MLPTKFNCQIFQVSNGAKKVSHLFVNNYTMDCSSAEIEKKRRLALAKLKAKKIQTLHNNSGTGNDSNGHNLTIETHKANNNQAPSPSVQNNSNSSNSLYWNSNNSTNNTSIGRQSSPKINMPSLFNTHNQTPYSKNAVSPQKFFGKVITGTMNLTSINRFEINLSGFHDKVIEMFKTIPSRAYGRYIFYALSK